MDSSIQDIRRYVSNLTRATGISDFQFAISIEGRRFFYCDSDLCEGDAIRTNRANLFPVGCIVKTLTALMALILSGRGIVDLSAPIGLYLSEIEKRYKGQSIKLSHLISHTSGLKGSLYLKAFSPKWTRDVIIRDLQECPQYFDPGEVFNYEQFGTLLLVEILTRITGRQWTELLNELILRPIGTEAVFDSRRLSANFDNHFGAGARESLTHVAPVPRWTARLAMTVHDLLSLCEAIIEPGSNSNISNPLAPAICKAFCAHAVSLPQTSGGMGRGWLPIGYAMGVAIFSGGLRGSDGNFNQQALGFRLHVERRVSVAVGVNRGGAALRSELLSGITSRLGLTKQGGAEGAMPFCPFELGEVAGRYRGNDDYEVEVTYNGALIEFALRNRGRTLNVFRGRLDSNRGLFINAGAYPVGLAVFGRPTTGQPCVMIGMSSFRKI